MDSQTHVLVGSSLAMREVEAEIDYAAQSDAKVLVTGESGVGKEVVAHLVHQRSKRSRMPLVALNCAGLPDSLLESSLFGHVRGSFTDAHRDRIGLLQHFLQLYAARDAARTPELGPDALQVLVAHDWTGNVRELKNVAERLTVRATTGLITVADLPREIQTPAAPVGRVPTLADELF